MNNVRTVSLLTYVEMNAPNPLRMEKPPGQLSNTTPRTFIVLLL